MEDDNVFQRTPCTAKATRNPIGIKFPLINVTRTLP